MNLLNNSLTKEIDYLKTIIEGKQNEIFDLRKKVEKLNNDLSSQTRKSSEISDYYKENKKDNSLNKNRLDRSCIEEFGSGDSYSVHHKLFNDGFNRNNINKGLKSLLTTIEEIYKDIIPVLFSELIQKHQNNFDPIKIENQLNQTKTKIKELIEDNKPNASKILAFSTKKREFVNLNDLMKENGNLNQNLNKY